MSAVDEEGQSAFQTGFEMFSVVHFIKLCTGKWDIA